MRNVLLSGAMVLLFIETIAFAQQPAPAANPPSLDNQYQLGPEWQAKPGVQRGKTFEITFDHSTIFPGTSRTITVYIPAQYTAEKPACIYVSLDGIIFHTPD